MKLSCLDKVDLISPKKPCDLLRIAECAFKFGRTNAYVGVQPSGSWLTHPPPVPFGNPLYRWNAIGIRVMRVKRAAGWHPACKRARLCVDGCMWDFPDWRWGINGHILALCSSLPVVASILTMAIHCTIKSLGVQPRVCVCMYAQPRAHACACLRVCRRARACACMCAGGGFKRFSVVGCWMCNGRVLMWVCCSFQMFLYLNIHTTLCFPVKSGGSEGPTAPRSGRSEEAARVR